MVYNLALSSTIPFRQYGSLPPSMGRRGSFHPQKGHSEQEQVEEELVHGQQHQLGRTVKRREEQNKYKNNIHLMDQETKIKFKEKLTWDPWHGHMNLLLAADHGTTHPKWVQTVRTRNSGECVPTKLFSLSVLLMHDVRIRSSYLPALSPYDSRVLSSLTIR